MYCRSIIFVASNEGSILISCTTSLALGLIKPHDRLDHLPPEGNVIFSIADQPINDKVQFNVYMLWEKSKTKLKTSTKKISEVCSIQEQSSTSSNREQFYDGCFKKEESKQDKNCQVNMNPVCDGRKSQSTKLNKTSMYSDNNCQDNRNVIKW